MLISMLNPQKRLRGKSWWLWPTLTDKVDAIDASKFGVVACGFMAVTAAIASAYNYFYGYGDIIIVIGNMIVVLFTGVCGYFIYRMSRIAVSLVFINFLADKVFMFVTEERMIKGYELILLWYLFIATRAVYAYYKLPDFLPLAPETVESKNTPH